MWKPTRALSTALAGLSLTLAGLSAQGQADIEIDGHGQDPYYGGAPGQSQAYPGGAYPTQADVDYGPSADEPIVHAGDGMWVSVDQVDHVDQASRASGVLRLHGGPPMRIEFMMHETARGVQHEGQVMTPQGPKSIRGWDESEDVTLMEYEGRRYRLVYQDPYVATGDGAVAPRHPDASSLPYPGAPGYPPPPEHQADTSLAPGAYSPPRPQAYVPPPAKAGTGGSAGALTPAGAAPVSSVELKRHTLGGTHTVLVPKGWRVEGGAWFPPTEAFHWAPSRDIRLSAPDGTVIHFRPHFTGVDERGGFVQPLQPGTIHPKQGTVVMPLPQTPTDWAAWVEYYAVRATLPNAAHFRTVDVRIDPVLTARLQRLHRPMTEFMYSLYRNLQGTQMRIEQQAHIVRSEFDLKGQRFEQYDAFSGLTNAGSMQDGFGGTYYFNAWEARDAVSIRAPKGRLEAQMPLLLAIVNSLRQTPQWQKQLLDRLVKIGTLSHRNAMRQLELQGQISEQSYRASQELSDIIAQTGRTGAAAADRGQRHFVNFIRETEDYRDPAHNTAVNLPAHYDRAFSNGQDTYLLTNDPSLTPDPQFRQMKKF